MPVKANESGGAWTGCCTK